MKPFAFVMFFAVAHAGAFSNDQVVNGKRFSVPDGFVIELVAKSPLVDRPISCDFDNQGRLYVTDSSGSNENVQEQLKKKPHRIVRLEDSDGDGAFDKSIVFAEQMMFPEGAMWHDGSLYVCAPPQIWKLTDTDGDGKADKREVWFDGQTLTGCANDLHGPFLGQDGWIYWCKGAFAKQTYAQESGGEFVTRAAHIFRRRPKGGTVEHVMTGGMDNPVELVFTPEGELVFNSTFLHHPHDGKRDGLVHAIYGGVYGKEHGVLQGHPRTGELMPVLANHDASAPSGLVRLESDHFGKSYQNNILCSSFNMHKIFRHQITSNGSMLQTENEDFIVCHDLDFHPTDIIEDADGSVLIVDTGGWYKLCCPTSQLEKPDVLGAIYRVRRKAAVSPTDPRGLLINWKTRNPVDFVADHRPAVRKRAQWLAAKQNLAREFYEIWNEDKTVDMEKRLQAVWTLSKTESDLARKSVRLALQDSSPSVRQAAAHVVSIWKDQAAVTELCGLLTDKHALNRRVAAEALGRIGNPIAIPALLNAAADLSLVSSGDRVTDRALEHSIIYALIQIGKVKATSKGLTSSSSTSKHVALMALSQMNDGNLKPDEVIALLSSKDELLRNTAWWIVKRNPQWADRMTTYFRNSFLQLELVPPSGLAPFVSSEVIQKEILAVLKWDSAQASKSKIIQKLKTHLLQILGANLPKNLVDEWKAIPKTLLSSESEELVSATIQLLQKNRDVFGNVECDSELRRITSNKEFSSRLRIAAFAASKRLVLKDSELKFICGLLHVKNSIAIRSIAVEALSISELGESQAQFVASHLPNTGPVELEKLLSVLAKTESDSLGESVVKSLEQSSVASSFDLEKLSSTLSSFGTETSKLAESLIRKLELQNSAKSQRLDQVLSLVQSGDPRRGQIIFHSTKASCISCHQMGYLGGRIGPSLSRIGGIRSERDLLEALMFPNVSFVRSYEPVIIETSDGRMFNGVIKNETSENIELTIDAQKTVIIDKSDIENQKVGTKSIMPSGLDKQFSNQQLADLIKFLKTAR